jgi:hypothetical protein
MNDEVRVYGADCARISVVWHDVAPFLERALKYAHFKYLLDDIYKAIQKNDMQLWLAYTDEGMCACFVTNVLEFPQERTLEIVFCGGKNMRVWVADVWKVISDFGRISHCKACEVIGRRGWKRVLTKFGFKEVQTIFRVLL